MGARAPSGTIRQSRSMHTFQGEFIRFSKDSASRPSLSPLLRRGSRFLSAFPKIQTMLSQVDDFKQVHDRHFEELHQQGVLQPYPWNTGRQPGSGLKRWGPNTRMV